MISRNTLRNISHWIGMVALGLAVTYLWPRVTIAGVTHSRPAAVRELLDRTPGVIVLDVRTSEEYAQGHLPGAILVPLDRLDAAADSVLKNRAAPVVVYCAVGGRSATAAKLLSAKGYTRLTNMIGGIHAWQAAGFPVVKN